MKKPEEMTDEARKKRIHRLNLLRNGLLIAAFILVLIPAELTNNWTPRIACVPLFLCIPIVKYAAKLGSE